MRLSTALMQQLGVSAITDQQSRLSKTQLQLATGKRHLTPADDPIASARTLDLQEEIRKHRQYQDNITIASNRLALEEATLASATNIVQRVRELAVQANNRATLRPGDQQFIAQEVRQALDELVGLANTRNEGGDFLFAGSQSNTQPYPDTITMPPGYYAYQGDANQRLLQIGPTRRIADGDSGTRVFEAIPTTTVSPDEVIDGTTGTPEVQKIPVDTLTPGSVYALSVGGLTLSTGAMDADPTLAEVVTALQADSAYPGAPFSIAEGTGSDAGKLILTWNTNGGVTEEAVLTKQDNLFSAIDQFAKALEGSLPENVLADSLSALDNALERINTVRSDIGARLNAAESQHQVNEQFVLEMQSTLSQVQDLDYADAIGRFNLQQVALQAAQQAFVKVQGLSLFNFLR